LGSAGLSFRATLRFLSSAPPAAFPGHGRRRNANGTARGLPAVVGVRIPAVIPNRPHLGRVRNLLLLSPATGHFAFPPITTNQCFSAVRLGSAELRSEKPAVVVFRAAIVAQVPATPSLRRLT